MSTIRFNPDRETIITASITVGLILIIVVNIAVLVPAFYSVFVFQASAPSREPIDSVTVQQAVQIIQGEEE